jgi:hypothetical protein
MYLINKLLMSNFILATFDMKLFVYKMGQLRMFFSINMHFICHFEIKIGIIVSFWNKSFV